MFNLAKQKKIANQLAPELFFVHELERFNICQNNQKWRIRIGDDELEVDSLDEAIDHIKHSTKELKKHILELWDSIAIIVESLPQRSISLSEHELSNILFLSYLKQTYLLAGLFPELTHIQRKLRNIFDYDISELNSDKTKEFNKTYLEIVCVNRLILIELYRMRLIRRFKSLTKLAQIAGPWSTIDLPMAERVWSWDDDEEYLGNRERARKQQSRYNPETTPVTGFFYSYTDYNRAPYRFDDLEEESPYPSSKYYQIP